MALLTRLAEIGLEIAEEAGRQAAASAGEGPLHDPGLTYSRAARAVRLTIALQTRLAKDLEGLGRAEASARRTRIHRLVERAIRCEHDDEDEIEQLSDEARERLWDDEALDEFTALPLGEAVARVCADLGLSAEAWVAAASGGAPDISLPLVGRVAAKPSGGASGWNAGLEPVPPPGPFGPTLLTRGREPDG